MSFPVLTTKKRPKMSLLELSNATQIRLPKIKEGLLQKKTRKDIALNCNVSRKTVTRDIQSWIKTPDFLNWIKEVWLDKYLKVDDVEAFRQATRILIRTIPQQAEFRNIEEIREIKLLWIKDERDNPDQIQTT